jgi:hypothetical protein
MASSPIFKRLGVYFTPPEGPLASFGAAWLGWDIATGQSVDPLSLTGVPLPTSVVTARARKYGFHATLKAPFVLSESAEQAALEAVLEDLSTQLAPVQVGGLKMAALGRFLALVPKDQPDALTALASDIVNRFEPFRAPMTDEAFAQKNKPHLSDRQRSNLENFGAPHVHEDFKFHMTLTDRLSKPHLEAVHDALLNHLAELLMYPLNLDALSLVGEAEDGQFHLIRRYPLNG